MEFAYLPRCLGTGTLGHRAVPEETAMTSRVRMPQGGVSALRGSRRLCAMSKAKTYACVWDALADKPEQAANLKARAELMQQIAAIFKRIAGRKPRSRNAAESLSRHE
jgi:hypothetical protein